MNPNPAFFFSLSTSGWLRLWFAGLLLIALLSTVLFAAFAQEGFAAADLAVATAATTAFLGVALYLLLLFLRLGLFLPRWVEAGFSVAEREAAGRYARPLLRACAFLAALLFVAVFFRYELIATRHAGDGVVAYVRWDRWTADAQIDYRRVDKLPAQWHAEYRPGNAALVAVVHASEAAR
ncbi:MAG: hypothetical protein LC123_01505 [Burkholderiales bacterium]|nr:hypothetical protein [Rhodocyclaceae bacterium]MCZ2418503.1 hypothetical protein [Burkholderiales bacterium]HNQ57257.1 hypothetical protein [Candidatus Desulfobacillus denitrificans]HNT61441.1 hypothetical protein [Candidatus Desulfobacillus denitrificans]